MVFDVSDRMRATVFGLLFCVGLFTLGMAIGFLLSEFELVGRDNVVAFATTGSVAVSAASVLAMPRKRLLWRVLGMSRRRAAALQEVA